MIAILQQRDDWGYSSPACRGAGADQYANRVAGLAETNVLANWEATVRSVPREVQVLRLDQFHSSNNKDE